MDKDKYSPLKLENQLCFPLYAASREVIRLYRPFLDNLELTYTQYIAMMVFWENKTMNVKELGQKLYLDSGTLTPVLKSLESKGYVTRERSKEPSPKRARRLRNRRFPFRPASAAAYVSTRTRRPHCTSCCTSCCRTSTAAKKSNRQSLRGSRRGGCFYLC